MPVPYFPPPEQQSLTMQMALNPNCLTRPGYDEPITSPSPPRTPKKPSRRYSSVSSPAASVTTGLVPLSSPVCLTTNSSASTPSTPSSKHNQAQCAGITKAGKRCTRQVKMSFAGDNGENDEENIPRFCYQHTDEILSPTGYYAKKTGNWVSFEGNKFPGDSVLLWLQNKRLDTGIPTEINPGISASRDGEDKIGWRRTWVHIHLRD